MSQSRRTVCSRRGAPQLLHYRLHQRPQEEWQWPLTLSRPTRNTSCYALTGALGVASIPRKGIQYAPITLRTVTSVLFALASIARKNAMEVDLISPRIQAKAKAKAKDVGRAKERDAAKAKEEDVEDGSSDHRLQDDGTVGMAMPKVTSQKV